MRMLSDSMYPWRKEGQIVNVDASGSVTGGDYVYAELHSQDDGEPAGRWVKRLTKSMPDEVELEQLNPESRFSVPRLQVRAIYEMVDMEEL